MKLTQERLKELFIYDPDSGIFTRKITLNNRAIAGSSPGSLNKKGYMRTSIDYKEYYLHRMAWLYVYGIMPDEIDHDDGYKDNNRIINLKDVSHGDNLKNIRIPSDNTSGHIGVGWHKQAEKWVASIYINRKSLHLGLFDKKTEAIKARKDAEKKHRFHENHGDRQLC